MTLKNNYRVEFVGGPNDGYVSYFGITPESSTEFTLETNSVTEIHQYELSWSNPFQAKYLYAGMKSD